MRAAMQRLMAKLGIGGFYLHAKSTSVVTGETTESIRGPYDYPHNPYFGARIYFFDAESRYHLRRPKGIILPPCPRIG
jgi:hypothetical protein